MHSTDKNYKEMSGRSVIDVATQVLAIIPDTEYAIRTELAKLCTNYSNQAPEVLCGSYCWIPFINILHKHITKFDTEWKKTIRTIVNGQ